MAPRLCPGYDIGDFRYVLHPFLHAQIEPAIAEEMITLSLEPAAFILLRERNSLIQTDNSPRYTDAGKQTRITFPSSGRIKDKLSQIKVGTRVSYSRFESVDASGSYEGNDIEIEQANTIRRC